MSIREDILFSAQFDEAVKNLNDFTKTTAGALKGIQSSFATLGNVAKAAIGIFAGREIIAGLNSVINAAANQEQSLQSLNTALALAGDYSVKTSNQFQAFASQLQKTTKFEDDLVITQLGLAKSFGATNDQALKMVKAAADLASATGISLDSAVDQLGKTLQGTTGTLGKTVPGIKGLTEESLKAGAAIDIVAKRFGGAAEASVNTFSGALAQAQNTFGDLLEEIGKAIVQNPVVIQGIKIFSEVIGELTKSVVSNQGNLADFIGGLVKFGVEAIPTAIKGTEVLVEVLRGLIQISIGATQAIVQLLRVLLQFEAVQAIVDAVYRAFKFLDLGVSEAGKKLAALLSILPGFEATGQALVATFDDMSNSIAESVTNGVNFDKVNNVLDSVDKTLSSAAQTSNTFADSIQGGLDRSAAFADKLVGSIKNVNAQAQQSTAIFDKLNAGAGGNKELTIGVAFDNVINFFKTALTPATVNSAFSSVITSLKGVDLVKAVKDTKLSDIGAALQTGAQAFGTVISGAAQGLAGVFSGGYLNTLTSFVQQVGQAPQAFLDAFKQLDGVIKGLLDSLPTVVQSLIDELPGIIQSVIDAIPQLVQGIIQAFSALAGIIADQAPAFISAILDAITSLVDAMPAIIDKLISGLPALLRAIMAKLPALISAILRAIPKIVSSIAAVIPDLIVTFLQGLPGIIVALVSGILTAIPQIIFGIIDAFIIKGGLIKIIFAIIEAIPQICIALVVGSIDAMKNLLPGIIGNFASMFSSGIKFPEIHVPEALKKPPFMDQLVELFKKGPPFVDKLKELFTNPPFLQKLKDLVEQLNPANAAKKAKSKIPGFAEGGQIVQVPGGFPNDSFPARLTSGELVIDRTLTGKLNDLVAGNQNQGPGVDMAALAKMIDKASEKNLTINISISEEKLAKVLLNLNRQGFRTA